MLVLAAVAVLVSCWMLASLLFPSSLSPATFEHYDLSPDGPRPLLDLALERYASQRGEVVGRETVKVERFDGAPAGLPPNSARWQLVACFFKTDAAFGRCARLVVSTRALFDASSPSLPPTQWPYAVESEVALPGRPAETLYCCTPPDVRSQACQE